MSFEVGIDLVELIAIKEKINERFIQRILSESETVFFNNIHDEQRKLTFLAGRFAAKEALFKAFKFGDKTANYKDFSIMNDEVGAPYLKPNRFTERASIKLSISHSIHFATAIVIVEKKE